MKRKSSSEMIGPEDVCLGGNEIPAFGELSLRNNYLQLGRAMSKDKRSWLFRLCCTGGRSKQDPYGEKGSEEHLGMVIFRDYIGRYLQNPIAKVVVIVCFFAYLGAGIYGLTRLEDAAVSQEKLTLNSTSTSKYWELFDAYFRSFTFPIDIYLPGGPYLDAVVFDEAGKRIIASKFLLQTQNMRTVSNEVQTMLDLRKMVDESDLNVTVKADPFKFFDQLVLVWPMTISAVVVATISMIIIALLLIPDPSCAIWVGLGILSIETGVLGFMPWFGLDLDNVTTLFIIISIGFSVDFVAHITYAFVSSRGLSPNERMRESLHKLGVPIVQSSVSTILSVIPLVLVPSYVMKAFFALNFLVMSIGALHGIFVLPVFLSLFGPGSCSSKKGSEALESWKDHDILPELTEDNLKTQKKISLHRRCKSLDYPPLFKNLVNSGGELNLSFFASETIGECSHL
ncbi:unnamed protein product [Darwinula stevensoni]|uniref:SSD domain-containing protein n=1 Tax=Darwinula stevensoni TaxID=69355 RepID=A0A7R8X7I2_9CRUS|nr:unnamed protein product [Darwinula stevensoni]CAG0882356.1 unnamed protein product [Darwinula stevensoni]